MIFVLSTHSQYDLGTSYIDQTEIELSDAIDTNQYGVWETGDYKILVNTKPIITYCEDGYKALIQSQKQYVNDTNEFNRYQEYIDRLSMSEKQLKTMTNGLDLKKLVLYLGPENEENNKGNSYEIESLVKNALEKGEAMVYYKSSRIYKLQKKTDGDYVMSVVKIYFDDETNPAFTYYGYIRW
jgi:hypothetical protein